MSKNVTFVEDQYELVTIETKEISELVIEPIPSGSFIPDPYPGTYLIITGIKLSESGDGDNRASELQLFIDGNDDYTKKASKKRDFIFDRESGIDIKKRSAFNTTDLRGADNRFYEVPDVNNAGFYYNFNGLEGGSPFPFNDESAQLGHIRPMPGFPIIYLS